MRNCRQSQGQSVWDHGQQVHAYYLDLIEGLSSGVYRFTWRLPEWLNDTLLPLLPPLAVMHHYHAFHDCGKPYCLIVDDEGRRHFPQHDVRSAQVAQSLGFPCEVVDLIRDDMAIHLLKDEGIAAFVEKPHAMALLFTGLAEIHANATMFGGIESQSFKQKWKQLNRRGKKIVSILL